MAQIPTKHMFLFADMLGIELEQMATRVRGRGRVRVPISEETNIICRLDVLDDYHHDRTDISMLCVHMRGDLHLVLVTLTECTMMYALDASKLKFPVADIFKALRNPDKMVDRFMEGVVSKYTYTTKQGWQCS